MVDWVLEMIIYHSYRRDSYGFGEKLQNVLLWGLASYISARKGGLVGSIHYPSDRMPNPTYRYPFLPRVAG